MMTYESLADGGFATGSMMGSAVDLLCWMKISVWLDILIHWQDFIVMKVADNVLLAVKEQDGWKRFY